MKRIVLASAVTFLVGAFAVIALSQSLSLSPAQQKCSQTLDKNAAQMANSEGREISGCVKLAGRGALGVPPDVAACFVADAKGKVGSTLLKTIDKELKSCVPPGGLPGFGVPDLGGSYNPPLSAASFNRSTDRVYSAPIAGAARDELIDIAGELFGPDVDTAVASSAGHTSLCQSSIVKLVLKCEAAKRRLYGSCKKNGIKAGTIQGTAALAATCFNSGSSQTGSATSQAKIVAICQQKMADLIASKCGGVALASAFPGSCSDASNFPLCVERRVSCRLCQQVNVTDQLDRDCDLFDDGAANESCTDVRGSCGDGVVDPASETCDDGNTDDGDCCSSSCSYEATGSACGDQEDDECANPGTCDGAGVCNSNDELAGTGCSDDENECTGDQCDGEGSCTHPNRTAGTSCGDPSDTDCNNPDTCNGSGVCTSNLEAAGTSCTTDGNVCTDDVCNASGLCLHPNNTASCSDEIFCNGADTCSGGSCEVHAGDPCAGADGDGNCAETCDEAADACTAPDPDGSACSDGSFCNGTESCSGGICGSSTGNPCAGADGDANCSESCDETADSCTGADPDGAACNDGAFCNGNDSCSGGSCGVHAGNPCSSGADCADVCNEASDNCFEAAGSVCNPDASECTDDICNGSGSCLHPNKLPAQPCTDDGLECTFDQCDGAGTCAHPAKVSGTACSSDGNLCTDDVCNGGGTCTHPNNSAPCDDGLFCNGSDTCSGGSCAAHAGTPCAGVDGDVNCKETCDETNNNCLANDPNGSACSNGQNCDGTSDTCQSGTCTPSGVCCGTVSFTFTVNSNSGGVFDSAEWPGGTQTQNKAGAPSCNVTIRNPSGNVDTAGGTLGSDSFGVTGFGGFSSCSGSGGEDGDGCQPLSCPPAGIGQCAATRPSCSAALNGSGSARYTVQCVDP